MKALFEDRTDAGQKLAKKLSNYAGQTDVVAVALPRGGVPVAFEVAQALNISLDICLVRKLGVPGHEELAMGAIASGGVWVLNEDVVHLLDVSDEMIAAVAAKEQHKLERREQSYRGSRPQLDVQGRTVILIDDGLVTGTRMHAAVKSLRRREPARIIIAVPTAAPETCEEFEDKVDEIICAATPKPFMGVGVWYAEFAQVSSREVRRLLKQAAEQVPVS